MASNQTAQQGAQPLHYSGRFYDIKGGASLPAPVQQPHPPIWVGASGERKMLPLVARHADVWHTFPDPTSFARKSRLLDELATDAGREPSSIMRASSLSLSEPWDAVRANAEAMAEAGAQYLVCGWPSEGQPRVAEFVETVLPTLPGGR